MNVIFYLKRASGEETCELMRATWNRHRQIYTDWCGGPLDVYFEEWKSLEEKSFGYRLNPERNKIVESGINYFTKEKPCIVKWIYKSKQSKEFPNWWKACSRYMDRETAIKTLLEKESKEYFMLDCKYKIVEYKR